MTFEAALREVMPHGSFTVTTTVNEYGVAISVGGKVFVANGDRVETTTEPTKESSDEVSRSPTYLRRDTGGAIR